MKQTTVTPARGITAAAAKPSFLIGVLTAIALAGIVPSLLVLDMPGGEQALITGPAIVLLISGIRFAVIVGSSYRRLFEMIFWLFAYVFLGLAPVVQRKLDILPSTTPAVTDAYWVQASWITIIGLLMFLAGSTTAKRSAIFEKAAGPRVNENRAIWLAIGALSLFAYYVSKVGLGNLFQSRAGLDAYRALIWPDRTTHIMVTGGVSMGLLVAFVSMMIVRRQRAAVGGKKPFVLPAALFVALILAVNPISSARYHFGTVALAVVAVFGAYATVRRFRVVSLGALAGLLLLFPGMDAFRRSLDSQFTVQDPLQSLVSGDFDSMAQIANTADYVATNGITWGMQAVGVVFFWVPRSWWPDKPIDTGVLVAQHMDYRFKNLSAPAWAEFFINGGWVGLIIGMALLGYFMRNWDRRADSALNVAGVPGVLTCILPFYMLIVLRGSLLQAMAYLGVVLACTYFVTGKGKDFNLRGTKQYYRAPDGQMRSRTVRIT